MSVAALKVSLVAGTASFEGGMASAAGTGKRTADSIRSSFEKVNFHEAKGGLMLLEDSLGFRLPRHLNSLLVQLPLVGKAMELALPFAGALVLGEKLIELVEHFQKVKEVAEKSGQDQIALGTAINRAFTTLDEKLLQIGIKADELNGKHLAALKKQLELINRQSMQELATSFQGFTCVRLTHAYLHELSSCFSSNAHHHGS